MSEGADRPRGPQSHSGGSSEDQNTDSENQAKTKPGTVFLSLTRCSACYNHKKRLRRDSDGESSSSAEDSGPELDSESDAESSSSSSSSCSGEEPPPEQVENAEPDLRDKTGVERQKEVGETSESMDNKGTTKSMTRRPLLVKSYSLPSSFPPQLIPWSLLPRPRTVVSTLHLQVLSQKQDDDPFNIMQQHLFEQMKTEEYSGEGRERINNPPYPLSPTMNKLLWQQRSLQSSQQPQPPYPHQQPMLELSHQHQQQPQYFDLSAQGQMLPPPPHTLPVLHPQLLCPPIHNPIAPYTQMHASPPQPYWYSMQNPHTY